MLAGQAGVGRLSMVDLSDTPGKLFHARPRCAAGRGRLAILGSRRVDSVTFVCQKQTPVTDGTSFFG